jgi:hypothetical protein
MYEAPKLVALGSIASRTLGSVVPFEGCKAILPDIDGGFTLPPGVTLPPGTAIPPVNCAP